MRWLQYLDNRAIRQHCRSTVNWSHVYALTLSLTYTFSVQVHDGDLMGKFHSQSLHVANCFWQKDCEIVWQFLWAVHWEYVYCDDWDSLNVFAERRIWWQGLCLDFEARRQPWSQATFKHRLNFWRVRMKANICLTVVCFYCPMHSSHWSGHWSYHDWSMFWPDFESFTLCRVSNILFVSLLPCPAKHNDFTW